MQFFRRRAESSGSDHYVPLWDSDDLPPETRLSVLDSLVRQFGRSLLNVSPSDIDRLKAAVDTEDSETIVELLRTQGMENRVHENEAESTVVELSNESFFRIAVKEFKTEWIEFFMKMITEKSIPFSTAAQMMQKNFKELWIDYRSLVEPILRKDMLFWDICTIQVPVETFTVESNVGSRIGTCNSIEEWTDHTHEEWTDYTHEEWTDYTHEEWTDYTHEEAAFDHWRKLNERVNKVLKTGRGRKVNAKVKVCCFADICKTGVHGLIQFLLMHKAPTSIFKTSLIKWIIAYKWERIWRVRIFKSLASYLLFFVVLHLFSFTYAVDYFFNGTGLSWNIFFAIVTSILGLYSLLTLLRKYCQLKRYIQAGRIFFPYDRFRGVKHYFSSRQNHIDLLLSAVTIYYFTGCCLYLFDVVKYEYPTAFESTFVALIILIAWLKALCYAQAFTRTGIFVLMIARVLQECLSYFILLAVIIVGFGLTMHMVAVDLIYMSDENCEDLRYDYEWMVKDCEKEVKESVDDCKKKWKENLEDCAKAKEHFGDVSKSMLTMVYSMLGMFDPQVLFRFRQVSKIMIALFVLYLAVQTIVMFNLLIAAMGDAFDAVRATEKESFLMARAKFINQYEASLYKKEIEAIEGKIGNYLYVLIPEDKQLEKSVPYWKGRMTHIKEDVKKIVLDFQEVITHNMNGLNQKTDSLTQNINQLTQNTNGLTQDMSQSTQNADRLTQNMNQLAQDMSRLTQNTNEMFRILRDDIRNLEQRIQAQET